jgi:hypothetical protein
MKFWKAAVSAFGVAALAAALVIPANAADESKITYGFFMNPVEVPGGKTVPAGLYGFKIVSESPTSTVVQIVNSVPSGQLPPTSPANKDAFTPPAEMPVVATFVAVPDFKNRPGNNPVTYYQARGGGAAALRTVFFSPNATALVVAYPSGRAAELAKAANRPVPTVAGDAMDANALKNASVKLTAADGSSAEVVTTFGKPGDTFVAGGRGAGGYNGGGGDDFNGASAEGVTTSTSAAPGAVPSVPNVHAVDIMVGGKVVVLH